LEWTSRGPLCFYFWLTIIIACNKALEFDRFHLQGFPDDPSGRSLRLQNLASVLNRDLAPLSDNRVLVFFLTLGGFGSSRAEKRTLAPTAWISSYDPSFVWGVMSVSSPKNRAFFLPFLCEDATIGTIDEFSSCFAARSLFDVDV